MSKKGIPKFNLLNKRFGRLVVIEHLGRKLSGNQYRHFWKSKCNCGNVIITVGSSLVRGLTKSCGCWHDESASLSRKTHGFTSKSGTKIQRKFHDVWNAMIQRCLNPNDLNYKHYGGRGIKICDRWVKFENFRDDMWEEYRDKIIVGIKVTLDRIDVNGNYCFENCRWVIHKDNMRNTRISSKTENFDIHFKTRKHWSEFLNRAIRENRNTELFKERIGCTLPEFKQYIESMFLPGMNWENHGYLSNTWQLDHIKGCNQFDLSKEKDRLVCFNYKNYQPLWYEEHRKKSNYGI